MSEIWTIVSTGNAWRDADLTRPGALLRWLGKEGAYHVVRSWSEVETRALMAEVELPKLEGAFVV